MRGQTCEDLPFDPNIGCAKDVPIVDGAIAYECPYCHTTYVLLFKNALHVPNLEHNLVPPFIHREAGIIVNDTAKIHKENPSQKDHALIIESESLTIPLQLNGIFSFFQSRCPTKDEINHAPNLIMTPDSLIWDPYLDHFSMSEESMLDFEGNMMDEVYRKCHCIGVNCVSSITVLDCEAIVNDATGDDTSYDEK